MSDPSEAGPLSGLPPPLTPGRVVAPVMGDGSPLVGLAGCELAGAVGVAGHLPLGLTVDGISPLADDEVAGGVEGDAALAPFGIAPTGGRLYPG